MIIIKAKLLHIFTSAEYINKETQQVTPSKVKLQLLIQSILRNNEVRNELLDITVPKEKYNLYKDKIGSTVEVEVGVIGKCSYYGI